jgi:uncharacterized protein YjbJ (UPF0337 family)
MLPKRVTTDKKQRRPEMDTNLLKGKWNQIKGDIKMKWADLTDNDLTRVEGSEDKLVGLLQEKYGYSKDKAKQEVQKFMNRYM